MTNIKNYPNGCLTQFYKYEYSLFLARHYFTMIAKVVFDLPVDGPFDYSIPDALVSQVTVGCRVKVSFGRRNQIGFVIGLLAHSALSQLKSIVSLPDTSAAFNELDLEFAREFAAYYGCSLGEALTTILRNKLEHRVSIRREGKPSHSLFRCPVSSYVAQIKEIIAGYPSKSAFLILVPDAFYIERIGSQLPQVKIGTRSTVFETDGHYDCVIMVDDEDASYKQEQTPMYETRQVLISRSEVYGFDIAFIGATPSVELMRLAEEKKIKLATQAPVGVSHLQLVDLTQYKYLPGMISPPLKDALDSALKQKKKSILILNRRGSYRLTRCVECGFVLKCQHCDSSLIYSRSEGKFLCRHCTFSLPGESVCPQCKKPSWRSQGIGVEQLQTELKKIFPLVKITAFEREEKRTKNPVTNLSADFDILISTQAVLRFQGKINARAVAFIDFDSELNRLDVRSAFNAFRLAVHAAAFSEDKVIIQTRNPGHYVFQNLSKAKIENFYQEELKLRQEFGFSPFKHWIKLSWRGKSEKLTQQNSQEAYNALVEKKDDSLHLTPPMPDAVGRKRDQFRFNVMVQADEVPGTIQVVKTILSKIKRRRGVIATMNVDP